MTLDLTSPSSGSRRLAARSAGALAVFVGGLVLVGWALDITALKSILPGWVTVKPNTALAFVLTGLALLSASRPPGPSRPRLAALVSRGGRLCALVAGLIGLLTLGEYLFGWDAGIDQRLFPEPAGAVATSNLGRMAPDTALCFVLVAAALWFGGSSRGTTKRSGPTAILGSLVTIAALAEVLSFFTPYLRNSGWGGLTMMALPTAVLFAILGATIVYGSWREALRPRLSQFSNNLWWMVASLGALAICFLLYSRSEGEIPRLNELRHRSSLLADELRQSGDDLTRMARTYVLTGDPLYKRYFQEILDIRDGRRPRPESYWRPYWDLVVGQGPAPRTAGEAIPLLELMRQAGFTAEEFAELAKAKSNSDQLALTQIEAMQLVESTGPEAEADRARARRMMHDESYHRAKAGVMGPIDRFLVRMDERTAASVHSAEHSAALYRYLLGVFGLALMVTLWRAYLALGDTLGGSVDEVSTHIARIGRGDFSAPIQVKPGLQNSVLGWLSETQAKLNDNDRERKGAEDALRLSEERFRIASETANDVVYDWDLKQSVQWMGRVDEMLGYEPGAFPRTLDGWTASVHPDDLAHTIAAIQAHLEGRAPYDIEYRVRRKDGVYRWWWARGAAARTPDGTPVRWIGSITDITERKEAEAALSEAQNLRTEAEKMGKVGGWEFDTDTKALTWTEEVFHIHEVDLTYQPTVDAGISFYAPASRPIIAQAVQRAIEQGEPFDVELEIFTAKGNRRHVHSIGRADPTRRKVLGFFQDITSQKHAEEEVRNLNAELEQHVHDRTSQLEAANKELEAFSYSVSHDLRAPLRAIDGFGNILLQDYGSRLDPEGRRVIGVIASETRRMGRLIDDLLAFSRLGRHRLESAEIDMQAMARAIFADQAAQAPQRLIELDLQALPEARGDPALIRVVWTNLLSNALKFTQGRHPALITIGSRREDGQDVYFIRDNGVGFDMTYADKLFGVFQRLHSADEFEGTGVGLALVQRVVHRHGGRIWGEGKVDGGATFCFTLPSPGEDP